MILSDKELRFQLETLLDDIRKGDELHCSPYFKLESKQRRILREILKLIGTCVLKIDEQAQPSNFHSLMNICKDAVWKVSSIFGYGDEQVNYFILSELLPSLQSKTTRLFVLNCIPACYCPKRSPQVKAGEKVVKCATLCEESMDTSLQLVVSSLQFILEADQDSLVQVLTTLHHIDSSPNTRALVFKLSVESLQGASIKDIPHLVELLLSINFTDGLEEILNELDAIIILDASNKITNCVRMTLETIWKCYPIDAGELLYRKLKVIYSKDRQINEVDVCIIMLLSAKNQNLVHLAEKDIESFQDIIHRLVCLNIFGTYDQSYNLFCDFSKATVDMLIYLLLKGHDVRLTLMEFCQRYRSTYLFESLLHLLRPDFYEQMACSKNIATSNSDLLRKRQNKKNKLNRDIRQLDCCRNTAMKNSSDTLEYRLIINSFRLDLDEKAILKAASRVMQEYNQLEGALEVYLSWKEYFKMVGYMECHSFLNEFGELGPLIYYGSLD